jgi:hypothetical protein
MVLRRRLRPGGAGDAQRHRDGGHGICSQTRPRTTLSFVQDQTTAARGAQLCDWLCSRLMLSRVVGLAAAPVTIINRDHCPVRLISAFLWGSDYFRFPRISSCGYQNPFFYGPPGNYGVPSFIDSLRFWRILIRWLKLGLHLATAF